MNIIYSNALVEQFRFPHSKKRRIRKKWAGRGQNLRPIRKVFQLPDGTFVAHPCLKAMIDQMSRKCPLPTPKQAPDNDTLGHRHGQ